MKQLWKVWVDYWFAPQTAVNLAVARIAFFFMLAGRPWQSDVADFYALKQAGVWFPVSFFSLGMPVFEPDVLVAIDHLTTIGAWMTCIGLFTRVGGWMTLLSMLYIAGLRQNFGKYTGGGVDIAVFCILGFACSRAGDYLSVDSLLRQLWKSKRTSLGTPWKRGLAVIQAWVKPPTSRFYAWPLRFCWMMFFILYFSAGISKLTSSGLDWAISDNQRYLLLRHHYSHFPPTDWGLWVAERPWVYKSLGLWTLLVETLCPLGMLHPVLRYFFVGSLAAMQFGIFLLLGVKFTWVAFILVTFIPWEGIWNGARGLYGRVTPGIPR